MKTHAIWFRLAAAALTSMLALTPAGAGAIAATPAPVWAVDPGASRLGFASSVGGEAFTGQFNRWQATIRFDPKNLAGSAVVVRVDLASARTGNDERDEALPGADWFDTGRYAQAIFLAKSFKDLGGGRYQAIGSLSLRGVTRPLTLPFQLRIEGKQARMVGATTIDRHAFGVGQGQFAGADSVPFMVKVTVSITARRA